MRYLLFIMFVGVLSACGSTDTKVKSTAANAQDSTTIQWLDPVEQELGKVKEGQVVDIVWRFKNTGDKPLVFSYVRPGCGCTVADKPEEPIAPGAEGEIKAKFDTQGRPFSQHKMMYVQANNTNRNAGVEDVLSFKVEVEEAKKQQ